MDRYLERRIAWVTGGASGMGRAIALALARAGADMAIGSLLADADGSPDAGGGAARRVGLIVYRPGQEELQATAREIEDCGVRVLAQGLDVTDARSVDGMHQAALKAFGKVDILVNAAGITVEHTMCGHPDDLWQKVIDVNLNGTYHTIKLCLPGMIERGWGRIVNIASTAASVGAPTSGAYCASKAAVVGLSRCVALEGAAHGVTCNTISPGWVETRFGKDWMRNIAEAGEGRSVEEYLEETRRGNPQKRLVQPREIGALAAFLCREEALGITMQDLTVSAGSLW